MACFFKDKFTAQPELDSEGFVMLNPQGWQHAEGHGGKLVELPSVYSWAAKTDAELDENFRRWSEGVTSGGEAITMACQTPDRCRAAQACCRRHGVC